MVSLVSVFHTGSFARVWRAPTYLIRRTADISRVETEHADALIPGSGYGASLLESRVRSCPFGVMEVRGTCRGRRLLIQFVSTKRAGSGLGRLAY